MKKTSLILLFTMLAVLCFVFCSCGSTGTDTTADSTTTPVADNTTASVADSTTASVADNTTASVADSTTTPVAGNTTASAVNDTTTPISVPDTEPVPDADDYFSKFDLNPNYDASSATSAVFGASSVTVNGTGATAAGTTLTITAGGTYIISGNCPDGKIIVEVPKTDKVKLVLNGLSLTCSDSSPLYIKSADKTAITLAKNSVNTLTDAKVYKYTNNDTKPNACVYSADDLTFNGSGSLTVVGNSNNAIGCSNDLKFVSGNITVSAVNNALKGNDSVSIRGGNITVSACDDAIKADETDLEKGFIYICGGTISIFADDDALQATNLINVTAGQITARVAGKSANCTEGTVTIATGCLIEK